MRDISFIPISPRERVQVCKDCGVMPVIFQRRNSRISIGCPKCMRQSSIYSPKPVSEWPEYDILKMAVTDWNHKNNLTEAS